MSFPAPPENVPKTPTATVIQIFFDSSTGKLQVHAPMQSEALKRESIGIMLKAIDVVLRYDTTQILKPAPSPIKPLLAN